MDKSAKVGIITMYYGNQNYGAVLQAYALPNVINNMGYTCEQISYTGKNEENLSFVNRLKSFYNRFGLLKTLKMIFGVFKSKIFKNKNSQNSEVIERISKRIKAVSDFQYSKIPHSETVYSIQDIENCKDSYDIFVCGSDQIWRIGWGFLNPAYWLTFVDGKKHKKISYAASMAMDTIPQNEEQLIREALKDYCAISIRENNNKILLDKILNDENRVSWVVDPTLLLQKEQWDSVAENRLIDESYVFAYLLGDNTDARETINKYARKHNLKVAFIPYVLNEYRACDEDFGDIRLSDISPAGFLSLIKNADVVFTDSFHGAVFSGIFNKNFYVLKRSQDGKAGSMNTRVYSLMDLYGCPERIIKNNEPIENIEKLKEIDFEVLNKNKEIERKKSLTFLENALNS